MRLLSNERFVLLTGLLAVTATGLSRTLPIEPADANFGYELSQTGEATINRYKGSGGTVSIPTALNGRPVTSIADGAFSFSTNVTSVIIPDTVTRIGEGAFANCTALTSATIPDSVRVVAKGAFANCTALTSVTIPGSVANIGAGAFAGCTSMTDITIAEGTETIGAAAFAYCTALTSVTIPGSIKTMESGMIGDMDGTFAGCTALTSVRISDGVTQIANCAFQGCTALTSVTIPESVTIIGNRAFADCSSLTKVKLPSKVTMDTNFGAWVRNPSLERVFENCTGLTHIEVSEENRDLTSIDGVVFHSSARALLLYPRGRKGSYAIPDGVTVIGPNAFANCTTLTSVTIPNSVTMIWHSAFRGCTGLSSLFIPDNAKFPARDAFRGCANLTSVTIPDSWIERGPEMLTEIFDEELVQRIRWGPDENVAVAKSRQRLFDAFHEHIHNRFFSVWDQPTSIPGAAKFVTGLRINIESDGRISDFKVVQSSGNVVMDESVMAAARRVLKVDPPPSGLVSAGAYQVTLNFELE